MKNFKFKSGFYEKLKFLLVPIGLLITSLTTQVWAYDASSANIYYDNTSSNWSDVQLFIGHSTWSSVSSMTKLTNSNNLYYLRSFSWGGYGSFYFTTGASGWDSRGENVDSRVTYTTHYSAKLTNNLSNSTWLFISSGSGNGSSVSGSTVTSYDNLNYQQTVQQTLSTDGGSTYSASTASIATVKVASYYLSSATSTSATSTSGTISSGSSSANCKAVRTATVTYTVSSVATGYTFVGWYDGSTQKSTSTTYTYNATGAKTITARFKENRYSLTFSHNGHGTISVGGSTVASGSTAYVNYFTTKTLVATPNTGYNFSSWTKSGSNTGSVTIGNASNASTTIKATNTGATITAGFTPKTTTITFNKQSGTGGSDGVTATYNAAMPDITPPTRDGYTFGGYWGAPGGSGPQFYNADGSSAATWQNENATYTLYAKWTENMSTVSLVASPTGKGSFTIGGDAATSTTAGVTTTRSVTAVPISGYHFVSWSITGGATISGTTDNPVTVTGGGAGTAATLTATFEVDAASYTITYGVGNSPYNNGSVSEGHSYPSGSSQTSGTEISLTATPTNAHYKLAGWYSEAACSSAIAGAGTDNPYVFDLSANTSVYAKLVLKQCTITLNKNGGSTGAASVTASHGSTLPSFTAHSRTGYTLDGYYTDPSTGTKIIDASGALVASTTYANASKQWNNDATSLTLYAHWTAKQTTVTLNKQSGTGGTNSVTATYDAAMPDADMPTRTGYDFGGYYTNTGGAGTQYYTNTGASARNWDIEDATKTLYAKWTLITYTITYNNMTGATNHPSNPANYNVTTATITLGTPTKAGYDFGGWFTDNGTWKNQVTSIALGSTGNKVLYAKWTAKTYDITYVDANNVATIAANPSTGSTDATINFTVTMKPGFKNLSVTAEDASSNTVTVTNPSSNNYRFTMPASAVTVTVTATALPIVYVLKTKHASSSLGDGATGFPSDGKIWAWKASGSNNFYTSPGAFPGPTASSKAATYTDDIIGDEWYRFIPDNTSYFDGSTAYHVILTNSNRILDTQSTFIENGSSHSAATHTGTIWIVPHGTDANTAYLYTSYPDEIVTPYNTTYYAGDHGSIDVFGTTITSGNSQTIATTKNRTLTATPASGYAFNRWITTGSVTVADATSATTTVSATGAGGTVTATYFEAVESGWYIKGDPAGGNWDTPTSLPLNRVLPGETNVYYRPVTLPATDQYFRFWNNSGNHQYGASSNNLAVTKGTKYNLTYDGGNAFKYSAGGTVWFVVDASGATKKCWLQDPVEFYSVNFGYSDGCKTFSAKDGEGNDLVSGNTYVSGTELTFTQTKKDGYTFVGWNTAADGSGSSLGTGSSYSVASLSADVNVYAIYTENKTAITITTDGHGTITTPSPNNSPYSLGVATTQAINASPSTGYSWSTWTISGTAALVSSASTQSNTVKGNGTDGGTGTVTATFTPKTYTITLHEQGATTHGTPGDGGTITVTYDANTNLGSITALPARTGYTFDGYYDNAECTGEWIINTDKYFNWDGTYLNSTTGAWQYDGNVDLYAKWVANKYTVTLDVDEANKGTIAGATTSQDIYFNDVTVTVPNRPTAANGYALDGYYTDQLGEGVKLINADGTWIASVDGYTDGSKRWIHADDVTLYAYYKKAEITAITFDEETVEAEGTVSFAVTISPTPTGTTKTCFTVLYSNDNPLAEQPTITYSAGKYSFTAPATSGTYKIYAVLRTGSSCDGGTELDTEEASFQVAGLHDVTVRYKCGDEVIKAATTLEGIRPLVWSDEITAPEIIGYRFTGWTAGDGVTLTDDDGTTTKTTTTEADIKIKAIYDGYLTANYAKKRVIYFNNTLGWNNVYVYFYKNGTYWNATYGTGCNKTYSFTDTPFSEGLYGQMEPIEEGSDIYYFDAEEAGVNAAYQTVVFTELDQHTYNWFSKTGDVKNKVIKRDDYYSTKMPMYVPLAVQTPEAKNDNTADYYWQGYWMNYPENTGYTLKIYNKVSGDPAPVELKSIPFEFTADMTMPMELNVDLEAGQTYGFKIWRNDGLNTGAGSYYGNGGTMTANSEGWDMQTDKANCGLQTTAAGNYKFILNFYEISSDYQYRVSVTYPVAVGDYRIVYTDGATWSGAAHGATWNHPSGIISKNGSATESKKDTVSFFWSYGSSPEIGYQSCSGLSAGSASWSAKTSISVSGYSSVLSQSGVYNFIFEQPAGGASISLVKVEPYTGNYYIRVDAANSKWDNYKTDADHLMTYSEYSIDHGGYSHYYTHWVQTDDRKNIKFCIANDYSPCISDTLTRETASGTWANIATFIEENGDIKRNANVRFMWDQSTNVISRAYVDGAQEDGSRFLVISSADGKIKKADGTALSNNEVTFSDNGNWIYEANIQAQPKAQIKLVSTWGTGTVITQYFKGSATETEDLVGGSGDSWYDIRVIYDFKTNRLISSYIPSGEIDGDLQINADVMFIREHQGDIAQLTFTEDSKISKIETAYGVLRLNKWTINNKSKADGHAPLSPLLSRYERDLFYVSFPFRVSMEDVFGFGTYGQHWIIEYYDGASRAANGYWQESAPNWKFVTNRKGKFFEPGQGYIIAIELDELSESSSVWANTDQVELYFPSYGTMPDITSSSATYTLPSHRCTIDRSGESNGHGGTLGEAYDRRVKDSHWNVMGVPTYVNPDAPTIANTTWTTVGDTTLGPNFLYDWNPDDNSVTAVSGATYTYHAMHAYLVQYWGNVTWTSSVSPAAAPRMNPGYRGEYQFRLELLKNDVKEDQTFVKLSDNENVTTGFEFNYDLSKEFNSKRANIYTLIQNNESVENAAGNVLPLTGQKTIVPVGVQIQSEGEYTFSMPDGTEGIGITLIDNETGEHTNLGLTDYTVNLNAGSINDRFVLEISPVSQTTTDIETVTGNGVQSTGVRKVMIDGILYIVRDGQVFDARGARVQ